MNRVDALNRGMGDTRPLESVEIPSRQGKGTHEEWAIRGDRAPPDRMGGN